MRLQAKKTGILALFNILVLLISMVVIWNSDQAEEGAAFNYQKESKDRLVKVYSTSGMKAGVYNGCVHYTAEDGSYLLSCRAKGDGGSYPIIFADEYKMNASEHELTFRVWVNSEIDYLLVEIETEQLDAEIDIESIRLKRQFRETFFNLMLRIGGCLLFADLVVVAVWKRRQIGGWLRENFYLVIGLTGIFCISALCVLTDGQTEGHDLPFHLSRIAGLAGGLAEGEFPVRIQPGWCFDYGYAVSIFYGDVLLYFPAVLYLLGVPLVYTYKFYVLLIHLGTIGVAYFCYQKLCHDKYIALFCTALSSLSVNRILNVYVRAAVGEYSAYMFLPLVLLGTKDILCQDGEKTLDKKGWIFLGIGMTGVLQTHILSFEMTCIVLGMAVIFLAGRVVRQKRWLEILKSMFLSVCLCAGFLIPFFDYSTQNLEVFKEKYEYGIQGFGLSLYELFSLPTEGTGHALLTDIGFKDRFPLSLGVGMIVTVVVIFAALVRLVWEKQEKNMLLFVLGLAGICIYMSTHYFPWNRLAAVPGVKNMVESIQIPWRFLSLANPLLAYAAGLAMAKLKKEMAWGRIKYLLLALCVITALQGMYCVDLAMRGRNLVIYDGVDCLREKYSLMGGEYLFKDTDFAAVKEFQKPEGENVSVTDFRRNGNRITVDCSASEGAYLEIPLFAYKYYRCIDEKSGAAFPIKQGSGYRIRVDLPADYQGTLQVFFEEPWYWRAAEMLSLFTLLSVCVYGISRICIGRNNKILTD